MKLTPTFSLYAILLIISVFFVPRVKAIEQTLCIYKVNIHVFHNDANYTLSLVDNKGNENLQFNKALSDGDIITLGSFVGPIADAMMSKFIDINEIEGTFMFEGKKMKFFKQDGNIAAATNLKDISFPFDETKINPCEPSQEYSNIYYPYNDIYYFGVSVGAYDPVIKDTEASASDVDGNDKSGVGHKDGTGSGKPDELFDLGKKLNKLQDTSIQKLLGRIIKTAMGIMGSLALTMIVYGGILWMTAMGNGDREKKGFSIIVWSSLGIAVIFASYALVDLVFEIFN